MDNPEFQIQTTYLLLGSNLGNTAANLRRARILISLYIGCISRCSQLYETAPWGDLDQSHFLNQAICVETILDPVALMNEIVKIEDILGKKKVSKWGPRTIDIDILLYREDVIISRNLEIPHPRMLSRNFVLIPLSEIAGERIHPVAKKSITDLVSMCVDSGTVSIFKENSK